MKLGLIGLVSVTALVMKVSAEEFYMASVFILGINVGERKLGDDFGRHVTPSYDVEGNLEKDYIKENNLKNGSVRFRFMMFKTYRYPREAIPTNKNINWELRYLTDFDLSFAQLNRNFSKNFFKDFSIKCKFFTEYSKDKWTNIKEITDSSFSIKRDNQIFETEDTHVGSLITNIYPLDKFMFSVKFEKELEIHLFENITKLEGSIFNFIIESKLRTKHSCSKKTRKPKFIMKSEEIPTTKEDKNKSADEILKRGRYNIASGFYENGKEIQSYVPFKINTRRKLVNVILVLNDIPIIRLYDNAYFSLTIDYEFPFDVEPDGIYVFNDLYSDDYKRDTYSWDPVPTKTYRNFSTDANSTNTLFSKWESDKEPISLTVHFKCTTNII